jgi:hypothetical protein
MPAPSTTLVQLRWKSVCSGVQVFRKSGVNCSENTQQKRALESALFGWFHACRIRGKFLRSN